MGNRPREDIPPWRETPLDHWSTDIDPAIMAGDEWAVNRSASDPGSERIAEQQGGTVMKAPFMHPMYDTTYGLEHDEFTSEGES
jgi:hypothetical protein